MENIKSISGNVSETESKVNKIGMPNTFKKLGVTKNDVISLIAGLVTGVTVSKITEKKVLGVAAGVTVTFVVADGLDSFRMKDDQVAKIEAEGGKILSADASLLNGFHIEYLDKDGNKGVVTTRK